MLKIPTDAQPRSYSHVGVESQQAKPKEWKLECEFCFWKYNKDQSDSMDPDHWCSLRCEIEDKNETTAYIQHQKAKPL